MAGIMLHCNELVVHLLILLGMNCVLYWLNMFSRYTFIYKIHGNLLKRTQIHSNEKELGILQTHEII